MVNISWIESEQIVYDYVGDACNFSYWWKPACWLRQICGVACWICLVTWPMVRCISYHRPVIICLFVTSLINSLRCERNSIANVGATFVKHVIYANLVQWSCINSKWLNISKYISTFRKICARSECSRIGGFSNALWILLFLSYAIFRLF